MPYAFHSTSISMARNPTSSSPTSPQNTVIIWLGELEASGAFGFEGIVRDALSELTGQGFELSKSGPQGGVDAACIGNRLSVGMEAKRYRETTTLALDELKAKVIDAVGSYPDMDVWVLATTREIALGDATALRDFGEERGVAVVVLDVSAGPLGINRLVALLAACPGTIGVWCRGRSDLVQAFKQIQQHAAYGRTVNDLRERLGAADVGWEALGRTLAVWMREAMQSRPISRLHLGTFGEVLAPGTHIVERPEIALGLDTLMTQQGTPYAVLGDEGHGKTWGVLAWWSERAGVTGTQLPPLIFLPAQHVQGTDPEALIAEALCKRTGLRTVAFWRRRLGRWRRDGHARLIVVLDGLNQARSPVAWSELVRPLIVGEWAGRVSVILTARPSDWTRVGELRDLEPAVCTLLAEPFTLVQLDTLLERLGKTRCEFDPRLIQLMRVPRLFAIAVERGAGATAITELTPEALAFEDYRHRLSRHGDALPLDEASFRDLVSRLGTRFRDAQLAGGTGDLTLRELREEIGRESGLDNGLDAMVSELAGGRWLEQVGQYRFRLDTRSVPMALGLALVDRLRDDMGSLEVLLPDFLDPFRGSDLGVSILRSASAVAMLQNDVPDALRITLLREWVDSPNFASGDFQTFWRLTCTRPGPVLDMAEAAWLKKHGGHGFDEILTKALSNAAGRAVPAGAAVHERLATWLSTWWPDYLEGLILGRASEIDGQDGRRSEVLARADEWAREVVPHLASPPALRRVESGEDWAWVVRRALVMASYMPRAGLVGAFRGWAAVSAIFNRPPFWDLSCWTLRLNTLDPDAASDAMLAVARDYAAVGHWLADRAAGFLLDAIASPAASALQAVEGVCDAESHFPLDPARLRDVGQRFPEGEEPEEDAKTSIVRHWATASWREEWIAAEEREAAWTLAGVARWTGASLGNLLATVRDAADTLDWASLSQLGRRTMYLPILFRQPERDALLTAQVVHEQAGMLVGSDKWRQFPGIPLRLLGAAGSEQVDILSANRDFDPPDDLEALLVPMETERWQDRLQTVRVAGDVTEVVRWLKLGDMAGFETPLPSGDFLIDLAGHNEPGVRAAAMKLLYRNCDEASAACFARSGWTWQPRTPRLEAAFGSLLLLRAKALMGPGILDRADQQVAGAAFDEDEAELPRLARFVAERVELITAPNQGWSTEFEWARMDGALKKLVTLLPDDADRWTGALYEGRAHYASTSMSSPLTGLLRGLLLHRPDRGAHHWREFVRVTRASSARSEEVERLPFDVPPVGEVVSLRDEALGLIHDDAGLAAIAHRAGQDPDDDWLVEVVRRDLRSSAAGTVGRALMLAGFARVSDVTRSLWEGELSRPPAQGWLNFVHTTARTTFRNHEVSLDLARVFATSPDDGEARDAYLRLRVSWDIQIISTFVDRVRAGDWPLSTFRERQWKLGHRERQARVDELSRDRRNTFCGTRTIQDASPWT